MASRPGIATATGSSSTSSPTLRSGDPEDRVVEQLDVVAQADRCAVAIAVTGEREVDAEQQRPQPQHDEDQDGRGDQHVGREPLCRRCRRVAVRRSAPGAEAMVADRAVRSAGAERTDCIELRIDTGSARLSEAASCFIASSTVIDPRQELLRQLDPSGPASWTTARRAALACRSWISETIVAAAGPPPADRMRRVGGDRARRRRRRHSARRSTGQRPHEVGRRPRGPSSTSRRRTRSRRRKAGSASRRR